MTTCFYHKETRSIADLVHVEDNTYLLTRINVPNPHRGKGLGNRLLREICKDADQEGATLILEVVSSGHLKQKDLIDWYAKNGFVPAGLYVMKREPVNPVPASALVKDPGIKRASDI